jgi:hypothetical protein
MKKISEQLASLYFTTIILAVLIFWFTWGIFLAQSSRFGHEFDVMNSTLAPAWFSPTQGLPLLLKFWFVGLCVIMEETAPVAKDFEVYTLGEIVVKGERSGVRDTTITTEVTPEDFEATNAFSVPEALTYTPGVVVSTGRKNQPDISVHGFNQERILMLIDGVP